MARSPFCYDSNKHVPDRALCYNGLDQPHGLMQLLGPWPGKYLWHRQLLRMITQIQVSTCHYTSQAVLLQTILLLIQWVFVVLKQWGIMSEAAMQGEKFLKPMSLTYHIQNYPVALLVDPCNSFHVIAVTVVVKLYGTAPWFKLLLMHMDNGDQSMNISVHECSSVWFSNDPSLF
jgi:hypothetical protein